jgi:asparagine synthase (glutamine-hydrolysing)
MCGIFGRFERPRTSLEMALCRAQTDTLRHRGPDGYGFLAANSQSKHWLVVHNRPWPEEPPASEQSGWNGFLGHRRLAILDLSEKAAQPMGDPEGRYWITFNGEIYNFADIRRDLKDRGVTFRTDHSDTEVLLMAYIHWGPDCLARLRGMFAFGILDLEENRVFLARDRLGKKPLYYRLSPDGLQFASEMKAILADPGVPRDIDPIALAQYMLYGYVPAPRTIYQGIAKLPPAHFALGSLDQPQELTVRRYWEFPPAHPGEPRSDWLEEFVAEVDEAVRIRMISDVPLGAFASGGLDSTLVVRQMHRNSTEPLKTFSIGFEEEDYNELPWARQVSHRYHTDHYEEIVHPDAISLLPRLVKQFDEPFGDPSAIPTLMVSELARRQVTVALSGDGGDELLAGYHRYHRSELLRKALRPVPVFFRKYLFQALGGLWPLSWKGKGFITRLGQDSRTLYRSMMAQATNLAVLHPDLRRRLADNSEIHAFFDHCWKKGPQHYVSRLQFTDAQTYLPEDILVKTDRTSMAVSLELRCPLLDHRVVELTARLPLDLKYRNGDKKVIIKQALLPEFGPAFINRKKTGFGIPLKYWFRGNLKSFVQERLLNGASPLRGLCDGKVMDTFVNRCLQGQRDLSPDLWRLLVLGEWCQSVHGSSPWRAE